SSRTVRMGCQGKVVFPSIRLHSAILKTPGDIGETGWPPNQPIQQTAAAILDSPRANSYLESPIVRRTFSLIMVRLCSRGIFQKEEAGVLPWEYCHADPVLVASALLCREPRCRTAAEVTGSVAGAVRVRHDSLRTVVETMSSTCG